MKENLQGTHTDHEIDITSKQETRLDSEGEQSKKTKRGAKYSKMGKHDIQEIDKRHGTR